ncbi:lactoylglutathione lyase-like [Episyrphus balteatus]|uniref:lactoylglutathione lyase-like n=1 Tax=Episyrphus balteatus TaxID=286459 RepID=UPI002485748D|nr:lactoylglutathione lyase-like [Episyrphus balteatus]
MMQFPRHLKSFCKLLQKQNTVFDFGPAIKLPISFYNKNHLQSFTTMAEVTGLTNSEANELCKPPHPSTKDFIFNQTMLRIKDPRKSLPFYTGVLGMKMLQKMDFPDGKFSVFMMGYENDADIPINSSQITQWTFTRKGALNLTHNWGTESDPDFKYNVGNSEPIDFGHIGVMVPDVYAACKKFDEQGVAFKKRPDDGRMKGLAFVMDPDGYWIEIFNANTVC